MSDVDRHDHAAAKDADPKTLTTIVVGAVGVILLFVTIMGLEVLYYRTSEAESLRKFGSEEPQELRRLRSEQLEQINAYRWVDRENGIVAIPIDRAMELLVEESKKSGDARAGAR